MIQNLTELVVLLDRSGSMRDTKSATVYGFNDFLDDQKEAEGVARLTLIQFGTTYETTYVAQPLPSVAELTDITYTPIESSTKLYDSLCRAIDETGQRLATLDEASRPGKVIFVVITDGLENDSKAFGSSDVKQRVLHQTEIYKWQFIFQGANQDAILSAGSIGVRAGAALTYAQTDAGIHQAYGSLSDTVMQMRSCASAADMSCVGFSQSDRNVQDALLNPSQDSRLQSMNNAAKSTTANKRRARK